MAHRKEVVLVVRMSPDDKKKLKEKSEKAGVNMSEYIRLFASKKVLYSRLTDEERKILKELFALKNTLTWLNNSYHSGDYDDVRFFNERLIKEIEIIIGKMKKK